MLKKAIRRIKSRVWTFKQGDDMYMFISFQPRRLNTNIKPPRLK